MKRLLFFSTILFLILFASCTKSVDDNSFAGSTASLWPLKSDNLWIYQDSSYDANGDVLESYADTAFITDQTTSVNGVTFYAFNDSSGWFGTGSYIAVNSSNTSLYVLDSLNATPGLLFALAPSNSYLLGSGTDSLNPSCIGTESLYGFAATYKVEGYNCYKCIENGKDCNGTIIYENVYYVSPGTGIVRIEGYKSNPDNSSHNLYLEYSQTLQYSIFL